MAQIEYYVCPLCGKTTPLKSFNPKIYPSTLGAIQIREGGGRGSGFKLLEEHPLNQVASQYPEVIEKVKGRLSGLKDLLRPSYSEIVEKLIINDFEIQIYQAIVGEPLFSEYILPLILKRKEKLMELANLDVPK